MQVHNDRSNGPEPTCDKHDDLLLYRRMEVLGLDPITIEWCHRDTFDKMKRRCENCAPLEACADDLKNDPGNPVWQTYCPNSPVLVMPRKRPQG